MDHFQLVFSERRIDLAVIEIAISEGISSLFHAAVRARCPDEDLDVDDLVGAKVEVRATLPGQRLRVWQGVCTRAEAEHALVEGVSTYAFDVHPNLWLLSQRKTYRIFQGLTTREIVTSLLETWGVSATWRVDDARHPRFDYRTQYGETDLVFASRLLDDDGIVFSFPDDGAESSLVFTDDPGGVEPSGDPIAHSHVRSLTAGQPFVTDVRRTSRALRGALAMTDFDFRRPKFELAASAQLGDPAERRHEGQLHRPGAAAARTTPPSTDTPFADLRGAVRSGEGLLEDRAVRELARERAGKGTVTFVSNVAECAAGAVVRISGHPRADLGAPLLVTGVRVHADEETVLFEATAVFAEAGYQPPRRHDKPTVVGVQSAIVTGPAGEEIHTDELGRVSLRFPWDRSGPWNETSSCWVRVSQGWAGGGYGLFTIPRIGHEVLVTFVDGDPDEPVVVGSMHNGVSGVPTKLPEQKTMSTFRTSSTPGGEGYNELRFEDRKDREHVLLRAERDLQATSQATFAIDAGTDHTIHVGRNRTLAVTNDETRQIGGASRTMVAKNASDAVTGRRTIVTEGERTERVGASSSTTIGGSHHQEIKESSITGVARDCSLTVGQNHSVVVGSEATPGSASFYVNGFHTITTTTGTVVSSDKSIVLICGESRIAMTPDRIVISSPHVDVTASAAATMRGNGPLLTLDDTAELSGDEVSFYSKSASVELGTNADIDGLLVRLSSKVGAKKTATDSEEDPTTTTLKVNVGSAGGAPYAGKKYRIVVDGQKIEGTTSGSGGIAEKVPKTAQTAHLTVWPEDYPAGPRTTYQLRLGTLEPATTTAGAQARLGNLGCYRGGATAKPGETTMDDTTKSAVRRYQETRGLQPTGALDAATVDALNAEHGG